MFADATYIPSRIAHNHIGWPDALAFSLPVLAAAYILVARAWSAHRGTPAPTATIKINASFMRDPAPSLDGALVLDLLMTCLQTLC